MRIAFFVHRFPVISEVFIANAAAGLIDQGHDVDIYGLDGRPETSTQRQEVVSTYGLERRTRSFSMEGSPRRWALMAPFAGLKIAATHGPRIAAVVDHERFGPDRSGLRALHEASMFRRGGHYDILHCHFGTLAEPVLNHRRAGFLSGKVVVHFRGHDISRFVRTHGEHVYDRVFREADAFVANCNFFRDRAIQLGAPSERTSVVASGIDLAKFRLAKPSWKPGEPLRLLGIGRLVEKKGFQKAVEALAQLTAAGLDAYLTLAGEGPLKDDLKAQAAMLGIADRVRFAGRVTHVEIADMLEKSHALLAPSMTASDGDGDASINTLKEAMAAGLPFVTSNHGGIPELVDGVEAGIVVKEGDAVALAEGVQTLLSRRDEWPDMGRRGRKHVQDRYSIEAVTDDIVDVYQAALDRTAACPRSPHA